MTQRGGTPPHHEEKRSGTGVIAEPPGQVSERFARARLAHANAEQFDKLIRPEHMTHADPSRSSARNYPGA